jgi:hypothetical protein
VAADTQNNTKKAAQTRHITSADPIRVDCWTYGATASNCSPIYNENNFFVASHFLVPKIHMKIEKQQIQHQPKRKVALHAPSNNQPRIYCKVGDETERQKWVRNGYFQGKKRTDDGS